MIDSAKGEARPSPSAGARMQGRGVVRIGIVIGAIGSLLGAVGFLADLKAAAFNASCVNTTCALSYGPGFIFGIVAGVLLFVAIIVVLLGVGRVRDERGAHSA